MAAQIRPPKPARKSRAGSYQEERDGAVTAACEGEVLEGATETITRCQPTLYLEADKLGKIDGLIEQVYGLGYVPFWHLAAYFNQDNWYGCRDAPEGVVTSIMLFCPPRQHRPAVEAVGFRKAHPGDEARAFCQGRDGVEVDLTKLAHE